MNLPTRCDNCGELAKENDVICWHCGQPLRGREEEAEKAAPIRNGRRLSVSEGTFVFYIATTFFIITSALVIMVSLGHRPQVQVGFGTRVPGGWRIMTDRDETFTTFLPDDWLTLDGGHPDETTRLAGLLAGVPAYAESGGPLGFAVSDLDRYFIAYQPTDGSDPAPLFMVVARSERLNRLTYDEARSYLTGEEYPIRDLYYVDNFDKSHLSIVTDPVAVTSDYSLSCWQQFIRGLNFALLVTTCSSSERNANRIPAFNTIHNSFQRLVP